MRPIIALSSLLLVSLCGCSPQAEGSRGFGAVITDSGMKANTDRNHRDDVTQHLKNDLDAALAPNWSSRVVIDELPTWVPGIEPTDGDWRWSRATVHITLLGSGSLAHTTEDLRQGVIDYMTKKVTAPTAHLTVAISQEALSPAPAPASIPAQAPATTQLAGQPRTYAIQANDTLADISTLFYGAPEQWRLIVNANPGLNPADLKPGTVLTIPARP